MRKAIETLRLLMASKFDADEMQGNLYRWQQEKVKAMLANHGLNQTLGIESGLSYLNTLAIKEGLKEIDLRVTSEAFGAPFAYCALEDEYLVHQSAQNHFDALDAIHEFTHYWLSPTVFFNTD